MCSRNIGKHKILELVGIQSEPGKPLDQRAFYEKSRKFFDRIGPNLQYLSLIKQGLKALREYEEMWKKFGCHKYRAFPIESDKLQWVNDDNLQRFSGTFDLIFITKFAETNRKAAINEEKSKKFGQMMQKWKMECQTWRSENRKHVCYHENHPEEEKYKKILAILKGREKRLAEEKIEIRRFFTGIKTHLGQDSERIMRRFQRKKMFEEEQKPSSDFFPEMCSPKNVKVVPKTARPRVESPKQPLLISALSLNL